MAVDAFLALDGIQGESQATGLKGWIEIMSWSMGATQSTSIGSATGGAGAGKVAFQPITIRKRPDKSSVNLWLACCNGKHFATVNFVSQKAGLKALQWLKLELSTVFIKEFSLKTEELKVDSLGKIIEGSDNPVEEITFVYNKLQITYTGQNASGGGEPPLVAGWDQTTRGGS